MTRRSVVTDWHKPILQQMWGNGYTVPHMAQSNGIRYETLSRYISKHREMFPLREPSVFRGQWDGREKEFVELLKQKLGEGHSYKVIATQLKVNRKLVAKMANKHNLVASRVVRKQIVERQARMNAFPSEALQAIASPVKGYTPKTAMDLRENECRMPLWGLDRPSMNEALFCAAPVARGMSGEPRGSWCQTHRNVCFVG